MCDEFERAVRALCLDEDREVTAADVAEALGTLYRTGSDLIERLTTEAIERRRGQ
jgi:hypothetical protein